MFESGYYPMGAEFDSSAPYNQREPRMVTCEACDGKGYHWFNYNTETDEQHEITEDEWHQLLADEDVAEANGIIIIQGNVESCEVCGGIGKVEYEEDYEPDYDDYYG